ncbi:MAG TPA: hypothetical protein VFN46_03045 [Acetobacteraceae bacterium]|nr:hypothetical protein [Acetobacteraceae bacterium]
MSRDLDGTADFERQLRVLLADSVQRVGGHARSRLNQARHAALAEAVGPGSGSLRHRLAARGARRLLWMPAAGAVAAGVLVAFLVWPRAPQPYPAAEVTHATVEDLDLLADRDGMDLVQGGDGQFYEWAMAQADKGPPAASRDRGKGPGAGSGGDTNSG